MPLVKSNHSQPSPMLDTCLKWIKNNKMEKDEQMRTQQSYLGPLQNSSPKEEGRVFPVCLREPHCFEDRRIQAWRKADSKRELQWHLRHTPHGGAGKHRSSCQSGIVSVGCSLLSTLATHALEAQEMVQGREEIFLKGLSFMLYSRKAANAT